MSYVCLFRLSVLSWRVTAVCKGYFTGGGCLWCAQNMSGLKVNMKCHLPSVVFLRENRILDGCAGRILTLFIRDWKRTRGICDVAEMERSERHCRLRFDKRFWRYFFFSYLASCAQVESCTIRPGICVLKKNNNNKSPFWVDVDFKISSIQALRYTGIRSTGEFHQHEKF